MAGPLSSLKILDFSGLLPGPFGTMVLADMGADIVRLEAPGRPDMVRAMPPMDDGVSACHGYLNRSKKSLAVDLKKPEGVEIVKKLVQQYDIIVEQFRPGVMARLGVGYEALKAVNPGLIYCSITGYGQDGPYKDRAGHDMNYLSIAGVTAGYNSRKASGPGPINVQIADVAGGSYHAVMGILAAVIHRQQTGEGQCIDISMTDAAFSMHALTAPPALVAKQPPEAPSQLNGGSFYDCYETSDGRWFSAGGLEPQFFTQFCAAIGKPELTPKGLVMAPEVVAEVKREIAAAMKQKTFTEWARIFIAIDACAEPVLTFAEACEHPQIKARGMLVDVPKPNGGTQKQIASAIKFSKTKPRYDYIGAQLGMHTDVVLGQAGFSAEQVEALRKAGVVA